LALVFEIAILILGDLITNAVREARGEDLAKMRSHYPAWDITISLEETIRQIVAATGEKLQAES
jgi:hypothetical protein